MSTAPAAHPHQTNGANVAAIMAAAFAIFALGAVVLWSELDATANAKLQKVGNWMPGASGIGPYSGKETLMVVSWLVAWVLLHVALRHKHLDPRPWFGAALVLLLAGLLGIWPPVWHWLGA